MFVPEVVGVEVGAAGVSAEVSAGACNVAVRVQCIRIWNINPNQYPSRAYI